jgi:ubiquinone/menaquinone biosynthesis C-methylase UbiE
MSHQFYNQGQSGGAAEAYEQYFVPAIGRPIAQDLIDVAMLRSGERVLDVACGTGVLTRLAAERVGDAGSVTGLDVDASMLEVARSVAPAGASIEWEETTAEAIPYEDEHFDVVLCQMGLQFIANKLTALREMRRVLAPGGRVALNVPGPTPPMFSIVADALARHIHPDLGSKMHLVFSLHDPSELRELMSNAGFSDVNSIRASKTLRLPPAEEFLWQYIGATPLSLAFAELNDETRTAFERDVCEKWKEFCVNGELTLQVGMTTATARK